MRSDSEEYRHLCECNEIMSLPKSERIGRINRVASRRGTAAGERIKTTLRAWSTERLKLDTVTHD